MLRIIDSFVVEFRHCFSRQAAFAWFAVIVVGLIVRFDHYGTTSFIRWLFLDPQCYGPMLRFLRAGSWSVAELMEQWTKTVLSRYPVVEFEGRALMIGDTIKVGKEADKMPGVKTLHQDSQNNSKPEFIRGHHFAFIGLLVGSMAKTFCVPLQGQITEGVAPLRAEDPSETVTSQMARLAILKARQMGTLCYVTLDAYFSVGPVFESLRQAVNEHGKQWVHVITRGKNNYVGFFRKDGNRYRDKDKVHLIDIFDFPQLFEQAQVRIKGEMKTLSYYCIDLLWQPVDTLVRFVCVLDGKDRYILMCSDLNLSAPQIIAIYHYRAKIETMFLVLKHLLGGFCYHFWTKSFPKLKKGETLDVSTLDPQAKGKLVLTLDAIERFVNLAAIALGLLHYISLTHSDQIWNLYQGWLRTSSSAYPSEAVVQSVLRTEFFTSHGQAFAGKVPSSLTLQLILQKGRHTQNQCQLQETG